MGIEESTPKRRRGPLARSLRGVGIGLGALTVALLLTEGALRLVGFRLPVKMERERTGLIVRPSEKVAPGVGHYLRRNAQAKVFYPGAKPNTGHEVTYSVNSLGFRGPDFDKDKPEGLYRIALLGDSVNYGTGINYEDTIAARLQQIFQERLPERDIQVINCGVPATNTGQQVALCTNRVLRTLPDLVMVISTIVDASGEGARDGHIRSRPWQSHLLETLGLTSGITADEGAPPATQRQNALRRVSRLADMVSYHLFRSLHRATMLETHKENWHPESPGVEMIRGALKEFSEMSERRNFIPRVAMYPFLAGLSGEYPFSAEVEVLAGLCVEQGIPFNDLLPPMRGQTPSQLQAHAHDRHPNGRANALVAEYLGNILVPVVEADLAGGAADGLVSR